MHQPARDDGTVLFHFNAGALSFDVLSTPAELERCATFLKEASAGAGSARMGLFGPHEVLVTRGTDDWSVRVHVTASTSDGGESGGQSISADIRRVVLLKALTHFISPPEPATTRLALDPMTTASDVQAQAEVEAQAESHPARRVVHTAADMRGLVAYVATHWTVPRIEVALDQLAELDRQRAQTRITQLAGVSEYQSLGPWAAVVVLVLGTIWIFHSFNGRSMEQRFVDTYVSSSGLWEYALGLLIAVGCAWFAGRWLGALWCRLRLLLALSRLWLRVRAIENAG